MKTRLSNFLKKLGVPALLAVAAVTMASPAGALAQSRGGHGGGFSSGARSYSGGHAYVGGGRSFAGGGQSYGGGRAYYGGGRYYGGGGYYRGGAYLGFGSGPYAYGPGYGYGYAPAPAACGYYDRWGYYHASPGCYVSPNGY